MKLSQKLYTVQEIMEITGFSQSKVSRIAKKREWQPEKIKVGRVFKNQYNSADVQVLVNELFPEEVKERKLEKTALVRQIEEENQITNFSQLPDNAKETATIRAQICSIYLTKLRALETQKAFAQKTEIKGENGKKTTAYKQNKERYSKTKLYETFTNDFPKNYPELYQAIGGKLSSKTLRRWIDKYDPNDLTKLADIRELSPTKGLTITTTEQRQMFFKLYLTPNKPKISQIHHKMQGIFDDLPTAQTFRNLLKQVPQHVIDEYRMGKKEYKDTYLPFLLRDYNTIKANDEWVSDGHDMDFFFWNPIKGCKARAKIMVWQDMATRLWVGWALTFYEDAEGIITSLKRGIEKYGRPKRVYTDNGKAYRGKRLADIYEALGVKPIFATPKHAQAKPIERTFRNFKESFSAFSLAYKGGNIFERPERLTTVVKKKENLLTLEEVSSLLDTWITWRNAQPHRGHGMNGRSPLERFNEELPIEDRDFIEESFLRESLFFYNEERKIQQMGIEFNHTYYQFENFPIYLGYRVKLKYDPNDLKLLYVYDMSGKMLGIAKPIIRARFCDSEAQIKEIKRQKKQLKNLNKKRAEVLLELAEAETTEIQTVSTYLEDNRPVVKPKREQSKIIDAEIITTESETIESKIQLYE